MKKQTKTYYGPYELTDHLQHQFVVTRSEEHGARFPAHTPASHFKRATSRRMMVAKFIAFGLACSFQLGSQSFPSWLAGMYCKSRTSRWRGKQLRIPPATETIRNEGIKTETVCRRRFLGYDVEMAPRFLNLPLGCPLPQPSSENVFEPRQKSRRLARNPFHTKFRRWRDNKRRKQQLVPMVPPPPVMMVCKPSQRKQEHCES